MRLFQRIRDLREDNDFRQIDVAKSLNIDRSQYQKYEAGTVSIPIRVIIDLAKLYNVSVDYILGLTNNRTILTEKISVNTQKALSYFNRLNNEEQDYILGEMARLNLQKNNKNNKKKDIG